MSRVIAVANQKGGVAKTTSVVSLGAAFAQQGLRVLLVDLDAQSSLTFSVGIDPDSVETSIADVLIGDSDIADTTLPAGEGLQVVPATIDLAGVEVLLLPAEGREYVLRQALEPVLSSYDVILLDCSPSLGLLTLNALAAADEVIVPLQCEMLSHRGVGQLLDTVADVQRLLNPRLTVRGLLPTMYDGRSVHSLAVLADVHDRFDLPVLPPIPRSVRFAEAPGMGGSILRTARSSSGAKAYLEVADALIRSWRIRLPKTRRVTKKSGPAEKVAAAEKVATEKPVAAKRVAAKKVPVVAEPAPAKPAVAREAAAKSSPAKPAVAEKAVARRSSAKPAVAEKATARPTSVKPAVAEKAAAKRAPAKKSAPKTAAAQKAIAAPAVTKKQTAAKHTLTPKTVTKKAVPKKRAT
jgi:chromosome partitioning protein